MTQQTPVPSITALCTKVVTFRPFGSFVWMGTLGRCGGDLRCCAEQFATLRALGCDYGQGYLFSRPLSSEQAEAVVTPTAGVPWPAPLRALVPPREGIGIAS